MRRARLVAFCFAVSIIGCGSVWDRLLGPLHEGPHRLQPTTLADIQRGHDITTCLARWAHDSTGYPDALLRVDSLVIVRVGGDGVIGYYNGSSFQTDERQNGDTIFINEGVPGSEFVGLERHGFVHLVQATHRELIGADGDIHWPPPWDACRVPRSIFGA